MLTLWIYLGCFGGLLAGLLAYGLISSRRGIKRPVDPVTRARVNAAQRRVGLSPRTNYDDGLDRCHGPWGC